MQEILFAFDIEEYSRIVVFHSFPISPFSMKDTAMVCQEIYQAKVFFPHLSVIEKKYLYISDIVSLLNKNESSIELLKISELYDFLFYLSQVGIVPPSFYEQWMECSSELLSPQKQLLKKTCNEGIKRELDTNTIICEYIQNQSNTKFYPSDKFIRCTRYVIGIIESALCLKKQNDQIFPYCIVPAYW